MESFPLINVVYHRVSMFESGGPVRTVCLGSALCGECVGAEFCLSKQLAAERDGRLS